MKLWGALGRLLDRALGLSDTLKPLVVPGGAFGSAFGYNLGRLGMPWGSFWDRFGHLGTVFLDSNGKLGPRERGCVHIYSKIYIFELIRLVRVMPEMTFGLAAWSLHSPCAVARMTKNMKNPLFWKRPKHRWR